MKMLATLSLIVALLTGAVLFVQADHGSTEAAETSTVAAGAAPPAPEAAASSSDIAAVTQVSGEEAFNTECSACHMAYPPAMLPARSWQAITGDLANHFGEDASLDPDTAQKISEYLVAHAAETTRQGQWLLRGIGADQVPLRITEMPWWKRAHYEVPAAAFARQDVMSPSNCLGCHRGGESEETEDD
jgi:cytochrome c5